MKIQYGAGIQKYGTGIQKALAFLGITAAVLAGSFVALKLAILLAPFLIAFVLASFMEPLIRFAGKRLKVCRKLAVPFVLFFILALPGYFSVALISRLIYEIRSIAHVLPGTLSGIFIQLRRFIDYISGMYDWPPELTGSLEKLFSNFSSTISGLADAMLKGAFATAVSLPEALIFILITIVATYFMSNDREIIIAFIKRQLPDKLIKKIRAINNGIFSALFGYLKTALILMSITFIELFLGFTLMHVRYALVLAVIIAIIDALPVLGTGSIILPWSVFGFVSGDYRLGTSLLILYLVTLIVRQLLEPKILSRQIGVHPLVTLAAMYVGLRLAGFTGLIAGPLVFLLIKSVFSGIYRKNAA